MITVLMSTYNGEKYLREQIDSILNQKDVEVQLLIRDDGSTDDTINILDAYKYNHSNVDWYSGNNLGAGKSFYQLALDAPNSDYYAFADQDDVWDPDKLAIGVLRIQQGPKKVPSIYCSVARPVDADLNAIAQRKAEAVDWTLGIALTQSISPGCSFVFNNLLMEKFKKIGIDSIDIHDWALLRVAAAIEAYVFFDTEPHFSYRQHGNNVIGYQGSIINQWTGRLKRFFKKENKNVRYNMANYIKVAYYDEMSEKNRQIIDIFTNYKTSLSSRISLFLSNEIRMIKGTDNMVFKVLALFGLV